MYLNTDFIYTCRVYLSHPGELSSALAIALSIFCVVIMSVLLGLAFSLILDKLNIDPADAG